ncbi:MAG: hypothetical protein O3B03_06550 [Proteobacteria bacterium]|nr:hypothetical protein [Pseudomonadota bacterium]
MLKFFIGIVILTFGAFSAYANDPDMGIIADENGCKVYNPMPQEGESIRWDGNCTNGFANGSGTLKWFINEQLKEQYVGSIVDGWADGQGVYTSHDGTQYDGTWVRSRQHGIGAQLNPDGSAYDGEWLNGRAHGWGQLRTPDGEIFEGQWRNGEPVSEPDGRRI